MNFYGFFLIYVALGVCFSAVLFYWAVTRGQFRDQKRIGFAPLEGEAPEPVTAETAKWPKSMFLGVFLAASGTISLVICAVLATILD